MPGLTGILGEFSNSEKNRGYFRGFSNFLVQVREKGSCNASERMLLTPQSAFREQPVQVQHVVGLVRVEFEEKLRARDDGHMTRDRTRADSQLNFVDKMNTNMYCFLHMRTRQFCQ